MKNLSLILNVVLLVAVVGLYVKSFSGDAQTSESAEVAQDTVKTDYKIAYVNSDSLLSNYDFFKDKQDELKDKTTRLEREYKNRAEGLQRELNDYQQNINSLTRGQAMAIEENLMKKQQNLRVYQESLTQDILKDESDINQELYDRVTTYLAEYCEEKGLNLVVKFNQGSDVLYATEGMDITVPVTEGLNQQYKSEQEAPAATASDSTTTK